jgi:hypothetical protein
VENRSPLFRITLFVLSTIFRKTGTHFSGSCSGCASLYTECQKKAGKIVRLELICRAKDGEIEVAIQPDSQARAQSVLIGGNDMGGTGKNKNKEPPKKDDDKSKKSPPATAEDDDREDGDFATPKLDRYGDDDQPL